MLFDNISNNMNDFEVKNIELPFYSNGIFRRLGNILYLFSLRSNVFHVTGDIHYAVLGLPSKKTILTIHDCGPLSFKKGIKSLLYRLMWFQIPCLKASFITTVSAKTKEDLLNICTIEPDKIHVVHNFISSEFFVHNHKVNNAKCSFKHKFITIGTKDNKNLYRIIDVANKLNLTMEIIGEISDELKSKLAESNVSYNNHTNITTRELIDLYISVDFLMFPSTFEGFGLPIIEAQALNLPVLTSNIEPMKSIAGDGAVLVDPYSEESITQGVELIYSSNEFQKKLINKGSENANKFSLDKSTKSYADLYRSISNLNR